MKEAVWEMKRKPKGRANRSRGVKEDNMIEYIVYMDEYVIWNPFI